MIPCNSRKYHHIQLKPNIYKENIANEWLIRLYITSRNHSFAEKHFSYSHCLYKIDTASKTFVVSLSTSSASLPTISIIFYLSDFYEAAKPPNDSRNSFFFFKVSDLRKQRSN